uniref:Tachykinin precursor 4 n=1 Tax=Felis catus TaxID=9685 RepID=A0ABI7XQY1_FELCA
MLPCLPLLLLMGLPACTGTVDEKLALGAEAGSWVTVTLEEDGVVPHIQLTLQEVKRGKTSQFFGLMGKRVEGIPPIQPERRTGKCCLSFPLSLLPGESGVVPATNKPEVGDMFWPGACQAGIGEGGASLVWPHTRLPGCFLREVVCACGVGDGEGWGVVAGIRKRQDAASSAQRFQNHFGSKAWNWKN